MRTAVLAALLLSATAEPARVDPGRTWLDQKLGSLEASQSMVFAARCTGVDEKGARRRETLALAPDRDIGILIEEGDGVVLNVATFAAALGPGEELETNGGVYTRERVARAIGFLKLQPFALLTSPLSASLEAMEASVGCPAGLLD